MPRAPGVPAGARKIRVCIPSPLEFLTRHHKACECVLCKQNLSKGKVKGGKPRGANATDGDDASRKSPAKAKAAAGADAAAAAGAADADDATATNDSAWDDFELGSAEDEKWAKEERDVANVITNGSRWAWEHRRDVAKANKSPPPPDADGLKRDSTGGSCSRTRRASSAPSPRRRRGSSRTPRASRSRARTAWSTTRTARNSARRSTTRRSISARRRGTGTRWNSSTRRGSSASSRRRSGNASAAGRMSAGRRSRRGRT